MKKEFIYPDFSRKDIEVRCEDNTVCIYGTANGLKKIIYLCELLIENPEASHQHLESHGVLTDKSLKCAIAIFEKSEANRKKVSLFQKFLNMFRG